MGQELKTDIVIIGGGPAGLVAAVTAKEQGVNDIILIEKLDVLSGNSKFAMNFFDLPNSQAMKAKGIEMSKDEYIQSLKDKGSWESEGRLDAWAESAWTLDTWLRELGAQMNFHFGPGTDHMAESDEYAGAHVRKFLEPKVQGLGIKILMETKAEDLLYEGDQVVGVQVQDADGVKEIQAKAVIVATGGFAANKELLAEYIPGTEILATTNQSGAEGDFLKVGRDNSIKLDHMNVVKIHPVKLKGEHYLTGSGDGYILVNENSERFMDETLMGLPRAHAINAQPNSNAFYLLDEERKNAQPNRRHQAAKGYLTNGQNIEELAEKLGLNGVKLRAEIEEFNKAVTAGSGDPYRETPSQFSFNPDGPVYGTLIEPAIHMTKGGWVIDGKAQVLTTDDEIVTGLFAAGEVTDQSQGFSQAVTFGRIAGVEASRFIHDTV